MQNQGTRGVKRKKVGEIISTSCDRRKSGEDSRLLLLIGPSLSERINNQLPTPLNCN